MKPILLVVWPWHIDYPLFRYNIERFRHYFASVWIAFSNHHQQIDYRNFIRSQMPYAYFVDYSGTYRDWRNGAINETLDKIKTDEPILFMEQDFLIKDKAFFDKVFSHDEDFLYFTEGDRVHPAFSLVSRKYIESTSKDFSAYPDSDNKDHFGKFFDEIPSTGIHIDDLGVVNKEDYYHLNGLSQNYHNFNLEQPFYNPSDFLYYNYKSIGLPRETHPQFFQIELSIERKFKHPEEHPFLDKFFI